MQTVPENTLKHTRHIVMHFRTQKMHLFLKSNVFNAVCASKKKFSLDTLNGAFLEIPWWLQLQ